MGKTVRALGRIISVLIVLSLITTTTYSLYHLYESYELYTETHTKLDCIKHFVIVKKPGSDIGSGGSGVILDSIYNVRTKQYENYILTCRHCVVDYNGNERELEVVVNNYDYFGSVISDFSYSSETFYISPKHDFAIIKVISPVKLNFVEALDMNQVLGEHCIAVGSPGYHDIWVTQGSVAGLHKHYLGHTAPINPGNSGGPLFDSSGKLMGINCSIETYGNFGFPVKADGISVSLPISTIINELRSDNVLSCRHTY